MFSEYATGKATDLITLRLEIALPLANIGAATGFQYDARNHATCELFPDGAGLLERPPNTDELFLGHFPYPEAGRVVCAGISRACKACTAIQAANFLGWRGVFAGVG
jgi:hypothetical protein